MEYYYLDTNNAKMLQISKSTAGKLLAPIRNVHLQKSITNEEDAFQVDGVTLKFQQYFLLR